MQDRQPTYPGRVKLTPVSGQANVYDMERADQPIVEGTALNKANLLPDDVCDALNIPITSNPKDAFLALNNAISQAISGDILLDTTLQTTGEQINLSVDGSAWGDYSYVIVDINYTLNRTGYLVEVSVNGSTSNNQRCSLLNDGDYDSWSGGSGNIGYMSKRGTSTGFCRIIFPVLKDTTNDVSCCIISPNSLSFGAYYQQRYITLTQLNFIVSSNSEGFLSGTTIKVRGKR